MKLLYSGASQHLGKQDIPYRSLGGYIASTEIPNDFLNNLFSDISDRLLENNLSDTKMIVLWNNTLNNYSSVELYFTYEAQATSKLLVAAVTPALDNCDNPIFESINSPYSKPYVGNFTEADGILNIVSLGNLAAGNYLGLWIRREIDFNSENFLKNKTCEELYDIKTGSAPTVSTQEKISMVINYTESGEVENIGFPHLIPILFN